MTKSYRLPPAYCHYAIMPPWGKLPVWVQTCNIPSSRPFDSYRSTNLLNDGKTEVTWRAVTLGLK